MCLVYLRIGLIKSEDTQDIFTYKFIHIINKPVQMIHLWFISLFFSFLNVNGDYLTDISFVEGDQIPNRGDSCIMGHDPVNVDPDVILLWGCESGESLLKIYNVSADEWNVLAGNMTMNSEYQILSIDQSSTTLHGSTYFKHSERYNNYIYSFDMHDWKNNREIVNTGWPHNYDQNECMTNNHVDQIYLVAGELVRGDAGGNESQNFEIFNVSTNEKSAGTDLPIAILNPACEYSQINGTLYLFGSYGNSPPNSIYKIRMSPSMDDQWTLIDAQLNAIGDTSGKHAVRMYSSEMNQEYIYIIGGNSTPKRVDLFFPHNDSIISLGDILEFNRRFSFNAAIYPDPNEMDFKLIVMGGDITENSNNRTEISTNIVLTQNPTKSPSAPSAPPTMELISNAAEFISNACTGRFHE